MPALPCWNKNALTQHLPGPWKGQTGDAFKRQAWKGILFPTPSLHVLQRPKFSQHLCGLGPPTRGPHLTVSPPLSPCSSPSPSPAALLPFLSTGRGSWHFSHQYPHVISHHIPADLSKDPSSHWPPRKSRSPAEGAPWSLLSLYSCSSLE